MSTPTPETLRALAFAAQYLNEPYERANAALAQEDRNG